MLEDYHGTENSVPTNKIIHDRDMVLLNGRQQTIVKQLHLKITLRTRKQSCMDNCIIRTDERSTVPDDIALEMDLDESEVMVGLSEHNSVELSQAAELKYTQDNLSTETSDHENDSYIDIEITSIHKKTDAIQLTGELIKVHHTD